MKEMRNSGAKLLTALIAMICMTSIAAGASVTVDNRDVSVGDTFTIDVTVDPEGNSVYSAQYDLTFDPEILQVTDQEKGDFLTQDGKNSIEAKNDFNNTIGKLEYGETRMGVTSGVIGAGVLATITFEAVSAGSTDLVLSDVVVGDPNAQPIEGVVLNPGTVNVSGEPQNPQLCTDPDPPSHDFGNVQQGETRTWTFDVTNCGGGTLDWNVSGNQSWITVIPESGSATTEADMVTVTIDTAGLSDGVHTGTATVSSDYGTKAGTISVDVTTSPLAPTMSTDSRDVAPGDTFTIDVMVNPAGNSVYSAQYDLTFDPTILQVVDQEKGDFLTQDGKNSIEVKNTFNNTIGKLEYGETRMGVTSGVAGSGVLATITFEAVGAGSMDLELSNVILGDTSAQSISGVVLNDGTVNVSGSPPQPIDLTPTTLDIPDPIYVDCDHPLDATISNLGSGDASSFNVTLKVDGVVVDEERVDGLSGNSDTTVGFSWRPDTTGSCTLLVEADSDDEVSETDESNNTLSATVDVLENPVPPPSGAVVTIPDVSATGMITVPITIENVSNVGSCQLTLNYDPDVVIVSSASHSDFDSLFANLEDAASGSVSILAYQTSNPGLDGNVIVANVTFMAVGKSGSSTPLDLEVITLTDATPDCNPIPYTIMDGSFTMFLNGDVNGDSRVDVADCMFLAKHLLGVSGFETIIEDAADVNGNGEIEASDCMYLAKHLAGMDGFEVLK